MGDYVNSAIQRSLPPRAELQTALNLIPAFTWYCNASGGLTFLNERGSDYLGLPKDHPLRHGIDTGAEWDSHISLLHPDDHEEARRVWSTCLRTGSAGQVSFRVRNAEGGYRWHLSRAEPVRASDGTLLYWIGVNLDIEDRKQAEFYLAEGQRLARTGSWAFNAAGFDYWSPELFRIYGLDPGGKAPTVEEYIELVHPDDREFVAETIQKMFAEGRGFDFTKRIVWPDGEIRRVRCVASPATHAGAVEEFVGTGIDVTEQRRAAESLRESESYLAEAQKLSHTGSWAWSPEKDIRYWSEECYRVLGFDLQGSLPRNEELFQRVHPDDQVELSEVTRKAIRDKVDVEIEYRIVHPNGAVRDIHSTGHPVLGPSGDLIELTGTVIDITERKQAEEELRASEQKYRHLVDTTPAFVHTGLPNGELDFFNRGWLEYLGVPITDLLGWRWTSAIHPEDVEALVSEWRAALESEEPLVAESRVRRADGEYRWFLHRKQPQRNEAGEIVKWYGSSIGIEERQNYEETNREQETKP